MAITKRAWDRLNKDQRASLVREISTFFKANRDEEIGVIAAEEILDFFLQTLGEQIYYKAVSEAKETIRQNFENLDVDLELLLGK